MTYESMKCLLLDAGYTLNYPPSGHWFIPPNFYDYVNRARYEALDAGTLDAAMRRAQEYLNAVPNMLVTTEDEEFTLFRGLYPVMLEALGWSDVGAGALEAWAREIVYGDAKLGFYDDVAAALPRLAAKYELAIVSDTWPSLDRVYRNAGVRGYFRAFVMSSVLAVYKPHPLMYQTALRELGAQPHQCVFVDDFEPNLVGAADLGIHAVQIVRPGRPSGSGRFPAVHDMAGLEALLAGG